MGSDWLPPPLYQVAREMFYIGRADEPAFREGDGGAEQPAPHATLAEHQFPVRPRLQDLARRVCQVAHVRLLGRGHQTCQDRVLDGPASGGKGSKGMS